MHVAHSVCWHFTDTKWDFPITQRMDEKWKELLRDLSLCHHRTSESDLGSKMHSLFLVFCLPVHFTPSSCFSLPDSKWDGKRLLWKSPLKGFSLLFKEMSLLPGTQATVLNMALFFSLIVCYFLFVVVVFLTSCSQTGRPLPVAQRLCLALPHHLSVDLRLLCVKMFWQFIPISANKVPMTEWKAETREETIWFMNICFLWGLFVPGLFPSFFPDSLY